MSPHEPRFAFHFDFCYDVPKGKTTKVSIPLQLPLNGLRSDYVKIYIKEYRIPCFAEESFTNQFLSYVHNKEEEIIEEKGDECLKDLNEEIFEELDPDIESQSTTSQVDFDSIKRRKNEESFGLKWHSLIHSSALSLVRAEESKAAHELKALVSQRDAEIKKIQDHHILAMEGYVNNGHHVDSNAVNDLAASQMDQRQACEVKWASKISHFQEEQKKLFQSWIEQTYLESLEGKQFHTPYTSADSFPVMSDSSASPSLEESFTVCIGSQLKITHNTRVAVNSIWDLFRSNAASPEQLQTSLSLYTNSLSGAIMLVDNRLNIYSGNTQKLSKICEVSPEFHFPLLEQQLSIVRQKLLSPEEVRRRTPTNYLIDETVPESTIKEDKSSGDLIIPTGTCYITRHSNLKQVHTILHLVSTQKEIHDNLSSRDSLLIGLKLSLKIAAENNVDNLYVPVLLCHSLDSSMNHSWCLKRAENVFKCVKGFMIEHGSTGVVSSKTFHFILPRNIPENTFYAICSMLPSVFRVPCPMILDQNSRKKTLTIEELMKLNIGNFS